MGFDHGAGGATGTAGAGGATGTAGAGGATGTAPRLRLSIVGTGYLGATHAVCMAELGFNVLGLDVDDGKIAKLAAGEAPFYEPGLEPLLRKGLDSGRLRFTTSYAEAAAFADVHFLCVGTPQKDGEYAADLRAVDAAIDGLLPLLSRPCLLVGKSTVPAGTTDRLAGRVAAEAPTVELAWNPEFLREGFAITDTMRPDRLVFGYASAISAGTPVVSCDCHRRAGQGGRQRLPRREDQLHQRHGRGLRGDRGGRDRAVQGAVVRRPDRWALPARRSRFRRWVPAQGHPGVHGPGRRARRRPGTVVPQGGRRDQYAPPGAHGRSRGRAGWRVLRWDEGRHARGGVQAQLRRHPGRPALDVAATIQRRGAAVAVYDPMAMEQARVKYPQLGYRDCALAAVKGADLVLHLTEWPEFREADPAALGEVVAERRIVDGRNALDASRWRDAGWVYRALGRP